MRMPRWLKIFLNAFGANFNLNPEVGTEVGPYGVFIEMTQGRLNDLLNAIAERDEAITQRDAALDQRDAAIARMLRIESRVIPRLFKLAKAIGKVLGTDDVTFGEPNGDETGVVYSITNAQGPWLTLILYPFAERFTLRDVAGNMMDQEFRLGLTADGELDHDTILRLNGFAEFANRRSADQTSAFWTNAFNATLAPVSAN